MIIILSHINNKAKLSSNWLFDGASFNSRFVNGMKVIMLLRQRRFRDNLSDKKIVITDNNSFYLL